MRRGRAQEEHCDQTARPSPGSEGQLEDPYSALTEELRPDVVAEGHARELGENALEAQPHGEVAGVHHLVAAPVFACSTMAFGSAWGQRARHVVKLGPREH